MRVLIACEFSGIVREAFRKRGHDAWSCDLLETEIPGAHIQADAIKVAYCGTWDMMIAHPPCTYLANSGLHYLKTKPERIRQLQDAFDFVTKLWNSGIKRIAIENPTGWLNTNWMKPNQIIQLYYFGDPQLKTTCLWLKNIPNLEYRIYDDLFGSKTATDRPDINGYCIRRSGDQAGKKYNYYWRQGKSAHQRSKTFQGIANAMADQWGRL